MSLYNVKLETKTKQQKSGDSSSDDFDESDTESGSSENKRKKAVIQPIRRPSLLLAPGRHHYGSFYLRMGAVGM